MNTGNTKNDSSNIHLPDSWVQVPLGNLINIVRGVSYDKSKVSNIPLEKHVGILRATNIQEGNLVLENDIIYVPDIFVKEDQMLKYGDIVVCMSSGSRDLVGKSAQIITNWNGSFGTFCAVIRFSHINLSFASYFFQTSFYKAFIKERAAGTNINNLHASDIEDVPFFLPSLPEQHRIVAAIEERLTILDASIASLKQDQQKLKMARASVLKYAVEGKLTAQWRADHPTTELAPQLLARILHQRRARWEQEQLAKMAEKGITPKDDKWKSGYKEPAAPDTDNLPELPEDWCWATVEQVAQIQGGIQKQPKRAPKGNAFYYLRVANVFRGRLDLSVVEKMELFGDELNTFRLNPGDLLIVEGNGSRTEIGRSAIWNGALENCVHQNHIIRVRLDHVVPEYVDSYWNSPQGNNRVMNVAASTSGLYTLSVGKIAQLPFPLPPLAEQQQIVSEVEAQLSLIADTERVVLDSLAHAERTRQSILAQAFSGQLVPQDPNDEPASVLLARIQEERARREQEAAQQRKTGSIKSPRQPRTPATPESTTLTSEQTASYQQQELFDDLAKID